MGVWRAALKSNCHTRRVGLVSVKESRTVQSVYHQVEVPIIIQVSKSHAGRNSFPIKAPGFARLFERQIAAISKRHVTIRLTRKCATHLQNLGVGWLASAPQLFQ